MRRSHRVPKRWLVKRRWLVVLEATRYIRIDGQQQLRKCLCVAGANQRGTIFVVKLYSRKIFFCTFSLYENIFTTK